MRGAGPRAASFVEPTKLAPDQSGVGDGGEAGLVVLGFQDKLKERGAERRR